MGVGQVDCGLLSAIMFNKFNQRQPVSGRITANRNLKTKSKLTVFMVYKMIEKRRELEAESANTPVVTDPIGSDNIMRQSFPESYAFQRRKERIHTEEPLIRTGTAPYGKRTRCQTELESTPTPVEAACARRSGQLLTIKHATADQASEMNRLIIEKLKKVVGNNDRGKKQEKSLKLEDFGLNITQIKRLDMPHKPTKEKPEAFTNSKRIHAKKSFLRERMEPKETIIHNEQREFMQPAKFQSLDHSYVNKNVSGKRMGSKQHNSNNYSNKLLRMFECLDIVLNSYHCFLDNGKPAEEETIAVDIDLKARAGRILNNKYYYYVGSGNNGNLIRSILRKRGWWVETATHSKANLVWSQLKIPEVLERVQCYEDDWNCDFLPFQQEKQGEQQAQPILSKSSCKKSSTTTNSESPKIKDTSLGQLFHQKQDKRYHSALPLRQAARHLERITTPEVMHNHYQQNYMFGNKNALFYNLSMHCEFQKKDIGKLVPPTYYLEKANPKSLADFEKIYAQMKKKGTIWILKPAENSNRGQGIIVSTSLLQIRATLNLHKKLIVQAYIKNLLLYNGRKFDIRAYMLAVTVHGRLKVFWYQEGYLRTSSEPYDLTNLFDSYIHLTNDAIQKTGENYGRYEEGNKLSYSEFQRYLDSRFPKDTPSVTSMHEQMRELARQAVKATYCRLDRVKKENSFELFGLDFIIDSAFKPTLIEINTNPCLELSSPILQRLIPRMMENAFRLAVDPLFRPKLDCPTSKAESYYIYDDSFLERNKFTLIFDEKYDRDFQWQERCGKMRGIEWGEGEQEEYQNQGNLIVVDY